MTTTPRSPAPRIPALPAAEWTQDAHDAYAVMDSSATKALGTTSNLVMTLANHPRLTKAYYTLGRYLLLDSSLPSRPRELVTLRIAYRHKVGYEWYHHVRFGLRIGLSDAEIDSVKEGPGAAVWSDEDRAVLSAADQLCERSRVDDATWAALTRFFNREQTMDLIFIIGHYVMVGWAISAFGVEIEPGFDSAAHPLE